MNYILKMLDNLFSTAAKNRAAKELLLLDDKQLSDVGLNREKLELGAEGYPWKAIEEVATTLVAFEGKKAAVEAAPVQNVNGKEIAA